jgi:2-(1,2-epoxy-1,2-dihydrophenyl)acetyl-CoA isomerase
MTRVRYEEHDGVAWVILDGPERRNAMDEEFWREFPVVLDMIDEAAPRAVVVTGEGSTFCAGGDIARMSESLREMEQGTFEDSERLRMNGIAEVIVRWCSIPAVRISAVNGPAIGAGLALVATCDYVVASDEASFDSGFSRIGLPGDFGVTHYLPRALGQRSAMQWLVRSERRSANDPRLHGLVDDIVSPDSVRDRAQHVAAEFASTSDLVVRTVCARDTEASMVREALGREGEATIAAKLSEYHKVAITRFLNRTSSGS